MKKGRHRRNANLTLKSSKKLDIFRRNLPGGDSPKKTTLNNLQEEPINATGFEEKHSLEVCAPGCVSGAESEKTVKAPWILDPKSLAERSQRGGESSELVHA